MVQHTQLKDICEILNGYAFKSSKYVDKGIRVIRITNVQKGYIEDDTPQYYPTESEKEIEKYMLQEGDLLMSLTGNVGRVAILKKEMLPAALNQRVACLRLKESSNVYKPYLFHLLNSDFFEKQCIFSAQGIAQKNMSTEWLKKYQIPLYSIEKQKDIAELFDQIDGLIDDRKKQKYKLEELVKSRFIEMFGDMKLNKRGWKLKSFEELTYLITDGEHATPKRTDKGIYLLSARNILNHSLQLKDVDYINEKEYDRIAKRIIPQEGDILISCSGTVGRCCSVPSGFHFQMVRSVALIRFKEYINPIFAEYMITSDYLQEQINSSKTVSSQANLFQGKIRTLKGFVPPIEMQNEFSVFVHKIDKSKYYNFTSYKYCVLAAKLIRQEWMLCQTLSF